ncbi:hypothetical protein EV385_6683 [Krasilnikovia cinnamomea]|uniref:Uncharacterized protein n=2 Tax=Krasilnikovia cinnamomea TaxID=349313 RepID=A0A4Q7Z835_9ACTN|nr:hypothetical protein EV385_6683 [Krasilnikovia cinnamomea]
MPATTTAPPAAAQITALQQTREYPAISVLLTTTPAAQLTRGDALRLDALAADAVDRVRAELQPDAAAPAVRRLQTLLEQAHHGPATHALALYASASTESLIRLPVAVRDRAVVDPTFATRDLVRALHRTPRHLVLALNSGQARLFDAAGDTLLPALTSAFPMHADPPGDTNSRGRADRPGRRGDTDDLDFYRRVDAALGTYLRLHPAPLVLVGGERATAAFRRVSTNCARLAGTVPGNLTHANTTELTTRVHTVLDDYLHRRQDEALTLIDQRTSAGRVASGMPAAWHTARTQHPEMLAVDESLYYPARCPTTATPSPPPQPTRSSTPTSSTTPSTNSSNSSSSAAAGSPSPHPAPSTTTTASPSPPDAEPATANTAPVTTHGERASRSQLMASLTQRIRALLASPQGKRVIAQGQQQLAKPENQQKIKHLLSKLQTRR